MQHGLGDSKNVYVFCYKHSQCGKKEKKVSSLFNFMKSDLLINDEFSNSFFYVALLRKQQQ